MQQGNLHHQCYVLVRVAEISIFQRGMYYLATFLRSIWKSWSDIMHCEWDL